MSQTVHQLQSEVAVESARTEPSVRVVEAVAAATGADPLEMAPLYDAVDPDALNAILESDAGSRVAFEYAGCDVVVSAEGVVVDGEEDRE